MRTNARMAPSELEHLLKQYAETRDRAVRDRIIEAHLYIASIVARKFSGRGVDYDDLYQVAALALTKAAERYSADRGVQFSSFVTPAMVGEVKNYFRDKSRVIRPPRRSAEILGDVLKSAERLTQNLGRSPRVDEIAADTDINEDLVIEALDAYAGPASLDQQLAAEDADYTLENSLGVNEAGYSEFETGDMLRRAIMHLTDDQRTLVRMRFYENKSQRDVAEYLKVSQMTVSRMEKRVLEIMRNEIGNGEEHT